eukprot:GFYU01002164.1.p1 GENE.GFYU01002164.1~~GFYU01002164.1.p1  ORF type:complete len:208 (-),score=48.39 GFYU01002164.1:30-653(-)
MVAQLPTMGPTVHGTAVHAPPSGIRDMSDKRQPVVVPSASTCNFAFHPSIKPQQRKELTALIKQSSSTAVVYMVSPKVHYYIVQDVSRQDFHVKNAVSKGLQVIAADAVSSVLPEPTPEEDADQIGALYVANAGVNGVPNMSNGGIPNGGVIRPPMRGWDVAGGTATTPQECTQPNSALNSDPFIPILSTVVPSSLQWSQCDGSDVM